MRYRKLSPTGDYVFGQGGQDYYANSPEAVGQAVETRLLLATEEWFLDTTTGTPYSTQVLGKGTENLYDLAFRERIINTPGVTSITTYESALDPNTRRLTVAGTVDTLYGSTPFAATLVVQ